MKINRVTGKVKDLFFVSMYSDIDSKILAPSVPNDFLTRGKYQNWQIPRIKLYNNIDDAISGIFLGKEIKGAKVFVYRALGVSNENLLKPSITDAPYTICLDEWWYTSGLRFEKLGSITIADKKSTEIYHYGPRSTKAYVYRWSWSENLESWKESKLKK